MTLACVLVAETAAGQGLSGYVNDALEALRQRRFDAWAVTSVDDPMNELWAERQRAAGSLLQGCVVFDPQKVPATRTRAALAELRSSPLRNEVAAGTTNVVIAGSGPLVYIHPMRRRAGDDHENFCTYWATTHADITRRRPLVAAYVQLHVDATLTDAASNGSGIAPSDVDGIAFMYAASLDDYVSIIRDSSRDGGLDDARHFFDVDRSPTIGLCQVL
jgi:hypothetical protein